VARDDRAQLEPVVLLTAAERAQPSDVAGRIIDAVTGQGLAGVSIWVYPNMNATQAFFLAGQLQIPPGMSGSLRKATTASATTDASGNFTVTGLDGGVYTINAWLSGYEPYHYTTVVFNGIRADNQNAALSPSNLVGNDLRVRLFWGESPSDLDTHFTGPKVDAADRFHVYYADETYSVNGTYAVALDLDDTSGYGPETLTVSQSWPGRFRYSVYNCSESGSTNSNSLSNSGAYVVVSRGNRVVGTFYPPPQQAGTLWTVFEMEQDTIIPVNVLSYAADSASVPSLRDHLANLAGGEPWAEMVHLLQRLPPKSIR